MLDLDFAVGKCKYRNTKMSLKSQGTTTKGVTYLHVKNRPFFDSNRKLKNT